MAVNNTAVNNVPLYISYIDQFNELQNKFLNIYQRTHDHQLNDTLLLLIGTLNRATYRTRQMIADLSAINFIEPYDPPDQFNPPDQYDDPNNFIEPYDPPDQFNPPDQYDDPYDFLEHINVQVDEPLQPATLIQNVQPLQRVPPLQTVQRDQHARPLQHNFVQPPRKDVIRALSKAQQLITFADPCSICLNPHTKIDSAITNCGHVFGKNCLQIWTNRNNTCPQCRTYCSLVTTFRPRKT